MSGFEVLDQIRKDEALSNIPVVVFTGRELSAEEDAELHTMARSIVVKGVESPERLLDETSLFLHRVITELPVEKQRMLEKLNSSDEDLIGKTALLVDDDARNIFALSSVLERRGMKVLTATTGHEAISLVESNPKIAIVLMDIMGLAARHPDRIRRIVSANGPTPFGQSDLFDRVAANARVSPWFQWIAKAEASGDLEPVLGQLGFNILSTLKLNGFENNAVITDAWLAAYGAHFARPADCLGAIGWAKGFATGAHQFQTPDPAADRLIRSKPALAIWGEADRTLRAEHFLPLFSAIFPTAPVRRLAGVGHYCFEDAPEEIASLITEFIRQT